MYIYCIYTYYYMISKFYIKNRNLKINVDLQNS